MDFPALPAHLSGTEAQGLQPNEPVAQFRLSDFQNFVYLILDWSSREAAIVDPQSELEPALNALSQNGFRLSKILLTHSHWDHVAGVPELLRLFPELSVHLHPAERPRLKPNLRNSHNLQDLTDGETLQVGAHRLRALHTPGHSAGECCFLLESTRPSYLFSGDTLFIRDCGNTTQPTGSNAEMFASLQKLKRLPPETIVLPGHQYARECASTLAREWVESAPFACKSVEELANLP